MSGASKPPATNTRNARAHYKVTRTVTGSDGQTHTETIEMHDDDAVKVSLMFNNRRIESKHIYAFV